MSTTVTTKGQVTIPKPIRDSLGIEPGTKVDFRRNEQGEIVLSRADGAPRQQSRFAKVRGSLNIDLSTDEIMAMLRDDL